MGSKKTINKIATLNDSHWYIRSKLKDDKRITKFVISELGDLNDIDYAILTEALYQLSFSINEGELLDFKNNYYDRTDMIKNIDLLKFVLNKNESNIHLLYETMFQCNNMIEDSRLISLIDKIYNKIVEFGDYSYIEKLKIRSYYQNVNFSEEIVLQKISKDQRMNENITAIKEIGLHCSVDPDFFKDAFQQEKRSEGYQTRRVNIVEKAINNFALSEDNCKLFAKGLNRGSLDNISQIISRYHCDLNRQIKTYNLFIKTSLSKEEEISVDVINKLRELKSQSDSLSLLSKNLIVYATEKSCLDFAGYICDVLSKKDFTYCIPILSKVENYWSARRIKERMEELTNNK